MSVEWYSWIEPDTWTSVQPTMIHVCKQRHPQAICILRYNTALTLQEDWCIFWMTYLSYLQWNTHFLLDNHSKRLISRQHRSATWTFLTDINLCATTHDLRALDITITVRYTSHTCWPTQGARVASVTLTVSLHLQYCLLVLIGLTNLKIEATLMISPRYGEKQNTKIT